MNTARPSTSIFPDLEEPIRAELFSVERLEQHAETLAAAQIVTTESGQGRPVIPRVLENGRALLDSYRAIARAIQQEHAICCRSLREENKPEVVSSKISQDSLAEMIGVTFRKELRKLASIDCNCGLHMRSLLTIVLHD